MGNDQKKDQPEDLGTQGHKDSLQGKLTEAGSKIQRKLGELVGNKQMETKSKERELKGKVQSTADTMACRLGKEGQRFREQTFWGILDWRSKVPTYNSPPWRLLKWHF